MDSTRERILSTEDRVCCQPGAGLSLNTTRSMGIQGGTLAFVSSLGEGPALTFTLLAAPAATCTTQPATATPMVALR